MNSGSKAAAVPYYDSIRDYYDDQLMILDLLIEEAIQSVKGTALSLNAINKMVLTEEEALSLLRHKLSYLKLSSSYKDLIHRLENIMLEKLQASYQNKTLLIPTVHLQQLFMLDELDCRVLLVMLAPHLNKKYMKLYGYIQDDLSKQFVTLELLVRLCARSVEEIHTIYQRYSFLTGSYRMLYEFGDKADVLFQEGSMLTRPILLNAQAVAFLLTGQQLPSSYAEYARFESLQYLQLQDYQLQIDHHIQKQMQNFAIKNQSKTLIYHIIGASGSGKTTHTQMLSKYLGKALLHIDITSLPEHRIDFQKLIQQFFITAKISNSILVFEKLELLSEDKQECLNWLGFLIHTFEGVMCLHAQQYSPLPFQGEFSFITFKLELPKIEQSISLWQHFSQAIFPLKKEQATELANKFRFTPGQMLQTLHRAKQKMNWLEQEIANCTSEDAMSTINESAYQIIHHGLHEKAVKFDSEWEWNDLILPDDTLQLLQQACYRIKHRHTVMQEWGFSRLLPYGRGISMLFTGPPGTGKSMSASVMAKQLQSELYRVDLSRVVSKYIGETEKNLAEIFDKARLSGAILFFDEADALFGKRSEVKDSHDKYANMETSYLLQKMEEYDGLTILATNFAQNLDEAFMRRIQFIVKFPFPNVEQREHLWRSVVPKQLPVESIDYSFLAKTFELSGGPIKNIILTAAYLAANDAGIVTMKHMIEAAIQEYKKSGKLLMKDRLGAYSEFWKG